jgi:hypothetical protein
MQRFRFDIVYQHAFVYPHNLYAYFIAAEYSSVRFVVFQAGMTAPNLYFLAANLAAGEIERFAQRYRLPRLLAAPSFRLHYLLWCFLSFIVLPRLLLGRSLPRPYDHLRCRRRVGNTFEPNGYLVYTKADAQNIENEYGASAMFRVVRNPVRDAGIFLNREVYGSFAQQKRIVILPSQDWANEEIQKARNIRNTREGIIRRHANIWIAAIDRLRVRYPNYQLTWKPHPVHQRDPVMAEIIALVRNAFADLKVEDGAHSAEEMMLQSRVIVSDVSTVLWWASLQRGLLAISLDLWGGAGGDALKSVKDIHYINSLEGIDALPETGIQEMSGHTNDPTVQDIVADIRRLNDVN